MQWRQARHESFGCIARLNSSLAELWQLTRRPCRVVEGTRATTDCRDAQTGPHDPERGEKRGCTGPVHSEDCGCDSRIAKPNAQPSASAAGDDSAEARACSHVMTQRVLVRVTLVWCLHARA